MSSSDVTREGVQGVRPDHEAQFSGPPQFGGDRGQAPRVARGEPEFTSYYGKPILNQVVWEPRDIATYLFTGGLAGASSSLAAGAQLTGRPGLARPLKVGAVAAIGLSFYGLIHDLGRPERFVNMLRTFKLSSPMSVGTWILSVYAPLAGIAAASDLSGRAPRAGLATTLGAGIVGPAVASYTAALIANTAVPVWHDAHRELPYVFVGSAASAAAGLALATSPVSQAGPARRLAVIGVVAELQRLAADGAAPRRARRRAARSRSRRPADQGEQGTQLRRRSHRSSRGQTKPRRRCGRWDRVAGRFGVHPVWPVRGRSRIVCRPEVHRDPAAPTARRSRGRSGTLTRVSLVLRSARRARASRQASTVMRT